MARQLTFDLAARPAHGRADFYVSPANAAAAAAISAWRDWPAGKLALIGPEGAGKTHLASVWAAEAGAVFIEPLASARFFDEKSGSPAHVIVEDVDRLAGGAEAEEALFHLHNRILAEGGRLLVTGRGEPRRWPLRLPDLASRMQGTPAVAIAPPDDALLAAVMTKHFADRQLLPPAWLIPWFLPRMPRSFAAAAEIVARLDADALERRGPIDRAAAHRVLNSVTIGET